MINEAAVACPLCGNDNLCGIKEVLAGGTCWCMNKGERMPQELLERVPPDKRRQSCICQACYTAYMREASSREAQ